MSHPYRGRHADLYDTFYAEKPYAQEAAFVRERLGEHTPGPLRRVLDLACGTGEHAFALEALGLEVTGVDVSCDMLRRAQAKARERGARAQFVEQDLRTLELAGGPWDGALCLFDALGYLLDNAAILEALRRVRAHVRPGGALVLELWHAAAFLREFEPARIRRWPHPQGEVVRLSETRLDCARQRAEVRYTIWEPGAPGSLVETQENRYFLAQELELLLQASGWRLLRTHAGFELEAPVTERTWHLVAVARREEDGT